MFLTACAGTATEFIEREIPAELLVDCPTPERTVATVKDLNLVIVEYHRALSKCDGQIKSIKKIVNADV